MKTYKLCILNTNDNGYNEIEFKGSFKKARQVCREHAIKKYVMVNDRKDIHYGILENDKQILAGFVAYYQDDVEPALLNQGILK